MKGCFHGGIYTLAPEGSNGVADRHKVVGYDVGKVTRSWASLTVLEGDHRLNGHWTTTQPAQSEGTTPVVKRGGTSASGHPRRS